MPAPPDSDSPAGPRCSARGCRSGATWALRWNNPRLHEPQRRKTWLACEAHVEHLGSFLSMRGMLRERCDVADLPALEAAGAGRLEPENAVNLKPGCP